MQPVLSYIAFALVVLTLTAGATPTALAGRHQEATKTRLAGPWYTPKELKALIAYSKASFAQKKKVLAGTSR